MKLTKYAYPILFITLILTSLACTIFVGGPDTSTLPPIPVSVDAAESIKEEMKRAFEAGLATGVVTFNLTEPQITSYLALRLQTDQALQQTDKTPLITDPQVYLRDGQMQIYGKTQQGIFAANIGIIVSVGVDEAGQPKIEIVSADFGPFPAPEGLKDAITAVIREAYTGSLGPVATGLRIQTIVLANGIMTITGRIR
ncbi:MAG: hypothetical protein L0287_12160 [Anaerolineae bacterium]|nr:hypothetical protein [Anaerolineae bacterium]MCI0609377.1 hypothetical protein [Anaerolineae bacterium]